MKTIIRLSITVFSAIFLSQASVAETKPLKALLLTGGCCHDYGAQKDILKKGIESRANITVDQIHTDNSTVKPDLLIYGILWACGKMDEEGGIAEEYAKE